MADTAPKMQDLMNAAYKRWKVDPTLRQDGFWATLSAQERRAVFTGNLNQQVENGGFAQWMDNGYGVDEVFAFLIGLCAELKTPAAIAVKGLLHQVNAARAEYEQDDTDEGWSTFFAATETASREYYVVNQAFLADVEKTL